GVAVRRPRGGHPVNTPLAIVVSRRRVGRREGATWAKIGDGPDRRGVGRGSGTVGLVARRGADGARHLGKPTLEDRSRVRQDARMIYNTEIFEVSDVGEFTRALERLRGPMTEAGGTDLPIYRAVDDPTNVLAAVSRPDAGACPAFAREHEGEVKSILRPVLTSHQPEDLWEEI